MCRFETTNAAKDNRGKGFLIWLAIILAMNVIPDSIGAEEKDVVKASRNERPSWTPDGRRIVFNSSRNGNYDLYIMNKDGTDQTNLTNSDEHELFPSVSRHGDRIAFVGASKQQGNYDIYIMDIDGSDKTRLTNHSRVDDWPSWRDDDQMIIFDTDDKGDFAVLSMSADGSKQKILVDTNAKTVDPMTTEASEWIVYSSDELDPGGNRQIYAFNIRTFEISRLTSNELTNTAPFISADGNKMVYQAGTDHWKIYSMKIDGSETNQLTFGDHDDKWAAWSPDGSEIAFTSNVDGAWQIYVMNADGSEVRQITTGYE